MKNHTKSPFKPQKAQLTNSHCMSWRANRILNSVVCCKVGHLGALLRTSFPTWSQFTLQPLRQLVFSLHRSRQNMLLKHQARLRTHLSRPQWPHIARYCGDAFPASQAALPPPTYGVESSNLLLWFTQTRGVCDTLYRNISRDSCVM